MKAILYIMVLVCSLPKLQAQTIQGRIKAEGGEPLPGVLVSNGRSGAVTETDFSGKFSINQTMTGDSLKISMIGFKTQFLLVNDEENPELTLAEAPISLEGVEVRRSLDAQEIFADVNLQTNPVNSSQDLLRLVPGLFIGQHAGGGKAEQLFLRGFDLDHGTDLYISVDGMPVNMVSHAHGQGYSDLHFVIPETVEGIEFSKGSYKADQGNFATAGSVAFQTKERLDGNMAKVEYGQFNHKRAVGLIDLSGQNKANSAYIASEYLYDDGPFLSPQKLNRFNLLTKINRRPSENAKLTLSASHFTSNWNASGQIPERAVSSGLISPFGAIDDTEGGNTSRTNFNGHFNKAMNNGWSWNSKAFYTHYNFELYSNFTFFAVNPTLGDQIRQKESRSILGAETGWIHQQSLPSGTLSYGLQVGLRSDFVQNNELSRTQNKVNTLDEIYLGNIIETNSYVNLDAEYQKGKWLVIPGIRLDRFDFNYQDKISQTGALAKENSLLASPKLSVVYEASRKNQFFVKSGYGYHSNDTRAAVQNFGRLTLPRSFGADLGNIWKPSDKILLNTSVWYLYLQQEFVYVGDEGIVEPSGRTRRLGFDLSLRSEIVPHIFFDSDFTYSNARGIDDEPGNNFIPLAPVYTFTAGLSLVEYKGFSSALKTRFLGRRPANEDYSLTAEGYAVTDFNVNYLFGKVRLGMQIQNLFNTSWKETQFATTSRLFNEPNPVEEIHFTPGTPFNLRTTLSFLF